jgi:DNA-binding NtrC family response regulator
VLALHLPPLRERVCDIAPLAWGVAARSAAKFGKELSAISPEAMAFLEAFSWPGNIRQLENVVQQAVLASTGPELLPQHLPPLLREENRSRSAPPGSWAGGQLQTNRDQHEQRLVERALLAAGNCCSRAARELGVSRATLYNKMKKYGIKKGATAALA